MSIGHLEGGLCGAYAAGVGAVVGIASLGSSSSCSPQRSAADALSESMEVGVSASAGGCSAGGPSCELTTALTTALGDGALW